MVLISFMGLEVFAGAFSVEDEPQRTAGSVFAVIGVCPVNSQSMVCEDITGTCSAGDFIGNVLGQTEVGYALREAQRLGALMWTETVLVRTTYVAYASVFLISIIES